MNPFVLRADSLQEFTFSVRIKEANGQYGVFRKTVDARNTESAWKEVMRGLKAMNSLKYLISVELQ